MSKLTICLIIFVLTIISFAVNYFSMATTALLSVMLLSITGCIDATGALGGFSNPNTIILVSMFIVSAGLNRTQMVKKMSGMVYKVSNGSFRWVLVGYVLITFLLGQFVKSPMAVFSIIYPMALSICSTMNISPSKIMFSLGVTSIATNCILPIGSGAVLFAEYNGYLETYQYTDYQLAMIDPFIIRFPVGLLVILYMIFIAPKFVPDRQVKVESDGTTSALIDQEPLDPVREVFGYGIFIAVILGLIFQSFIGLENWQITMLGAVLMVATGVLKPVEAVRSMNLNIVLLYVGALGIGNALTVTGAGEVVGNSIAGFLGDSPSGYMIGFVFFIVPFLLTQVMMNNGVVNTFIPICILTCKTLGCNPVGPIMLVVTGSLTAFMTPLATPAVAMMMSGGGYSMKELLKMSILPAVLIAIVAVTWTMTMYPAFP